MLLLPEQKDELPFDSNNPFACFNWFQAEDNTRDHGEALSIRQMVEAMLARYSIDRSRIYIVGFSAGGAMTIAMLAAYPELFAGGASVAGVPYGCADNDRTALLCMNVGVDLSADEWRRRIGDTSALDRYSPPISIWQGDGDNVVVPVNKLQLVRQWTAVKRISAMPVRTEVDGAIVREVFANNAGAVAIESITVRGLGHAFPIRTDDGPPCGQPDDFIVAAGVCAAAEIVRFWGLTRTPH
jgi:poly(hydroxyalkanoate) depolymerase family esterase